MEIQKYLDVILPVVKELGAELKKAWLVFDRQATELKSQHEIVTAHDAAVEKRLRGAIKENFPDHGIIGEEIGSDKQTAEWLWTIDPIDGTTNFTMHNPLWAISLGLMHQGQVVAAVTYAPILDELFVAVVGQGATLNGRIIKVSTVAKDKVLNTFCHGYSQAAINKAMAYFKAQKLNGFDCRQLGSATLELAFVAAGRVESLVIPEARVWDVAAGVLLVTEAGGQVTDFQGSPWTINSPDLAATNGLVHDEVLQILRSI